MKRAASRTGHDRARRPGAHGEPPVEPTRSRFTLAVVLVALALAATTNERTIGSVPDERQMAFTAVALSELGEIGTARGPTFTFPRPGGDSVSPYGMGLSLVEVPVTLAARTWESWFGPCSSQTLFAALQLLLVLLASIAAGRLAGLLGAPPGGEALAVVATALASPLWAYSSTALSEPLQAACLAGALLFSARAVRSTGSRGIRLAAASGFLAGWALLTKSTNILLFPVVLLPLALDALPDVTRARRARLLSAAFAGSLLPATTWLVFEILRFGRPFSSYGGQTFCHPFLDGAWRLLAGLNKGLVFYFPLALLGLALLPRLARRPESRGTAGAIGATFFCLVGLHASWWAWDGTHGWGPRFLVPAIPLLAAAACTVGAASRAARVRDILLGAGFLVNLLGILQPEATASWYVASTGKMPIPKGQADWLPDRYVIRGADGVAEAGSIFLAASDREFSPFRTHLFLLRLRLQDVSPRERLRLLQDPPWREAHPRALPALAYPENTTFNILTRNLIDPFSWPVLGQATFGDASWRRRSFLSLWGMGLADQVERKLDTGKPSEAVPLARRLCDANPSPRSAAILAESLRLSGRGEEARAFIAALVEPQARSPYVLTESALLARDEGDEARARSLLSAAQAMARSPILARALQEPLSAWPATLREMTGEVVEPPSPSTSSR